MRRVQNEVGQGNEQAVESGHHARRWPVVTMSSVPAAGHVVFARWQDGARALLAAVCVVFALAGCSLLPEVKEETAGWSADRLYRTAHDTMVEGNYIRAIKLFDTLEARFPYGRYAQQAILESAYANWRGNEQAAAIAACDRFIRTYPNHPNVDYAFYLKGLVHFREDQGLIGYVYELDLSERDPKEMRSSFAAFKELTSRFPDSQYFQDSIARMRYLNNAMSTYETHVANYYYQRGAYIAAANRAQGALINFPQTPANARALDIMRKSYQKLRHGAARRRFAADPGQDLPRQPLRDGRQRQALVRLLVEGGERVRRDPDRRHGRPSHGGSSGTDRRGRKASCSTQRLVARRPPALHRPGRCAVNSLM